MMKDDMDKPTIIFEYEKSVMPEKISRLCDIDEELIDDIVSSTHELASSGLKHVALVSLMHALVSSSHFLAANSDDAYFDAFMRFLKASFEIQNTELDSDVVSGFYWPIISGLERIESGHPDDLRLKALFVSMLEEAANFCVVSRLFDEACGFYCYLRNKFVDYSDEFNMMRHIARTDNKLFLPCLLSGNREEAKQFGEEAYNICRALYEDEPENYAADLLEVCGNLGGMYFEDGDYGMAKEVFACGLEARDTLFQSEKDNPAVALMSISLDENIRRLNNAMQQQDVSIV